ncbi:LOW QUALITY PROTEIN: helicase with zinc finger domain 2-like [Haliotis rubra]|uniref:LOW QUALITY PROTEIN: helicase with zinc finger domain 2-like n=1 Tax=Haliotis rubra TaxID=36100 RepID=UPI001EE597D0|nr:LOW QUALITY PROTEIN: helicase with zinc finger domain 2-like [Haliotis rubra]
MDPSWSNGGKPPDESTARDQRKARIQPFWEDLSDDKEPRTTKPALLQLMQDLKDEGNTLFKETMYDLAWMHYRNALFVARMLEMRFYYEVKKDFISTLFSNRALCCLKKELFEEAVADCDSAIRTQPTNLKAYYRKVQALKALHKYQDALQLAQTGYAKQPTVFKDLLDELQVLCQQPSPAAPRKTSQVSINDAKPAAKTEVDNEWLQGTNALKAEKQREVAVAKMPKKKKANKSNGVKSAPVQTPAHSVEKESTTDESDGDSSDLGEDEKFVKQLQSVRTNVKKAAPFKITQPKVPKEEEAWASPLLPRHWRRHDALRSLHEGGTNRIQDFNQCPTLHSTHKISWATAVAPTMGLDDFGAPGRMAETRAGSVSRASPDRRSPKPAAKTPQIEIDWPLKDEFDFQLACKVCFQKIGEGVKGYVYKPFRHNCLKNFFLIRLKDKENLNWLKVRSRAESQIHRNANYKICQQFQNSVPCRVGEERCTFPHHWPEVRLWGMDREGKFIITEFVEHLKKIGVDTSIGRVPASSVTDLSQKHVIPGMNYQTATPTAQAKPVPAGPTHMPSAPPPSRQSPLITKQPAVGIPLIPGSAMMQQPQQFTIHPLTFQFHPPTFEDPHQMTSPIAYAPPEEYRPPAATHPDGDAGSRVKMDNPIAETYEFKVMCKMCLCYNNFPGRYIYSPHPHLCEENLLAMRGRQGNNPWYRVRERKNHREFPGNYVICNSVTYNRIDWCHYGEENCSFAHNIIEQILWTLEKDGGNFNVTEFIMQNRSSSKNRGFSLNEILSKHGGYFAFICRNCYYSQPPMIATEGGSGFCKGMFKHPWQSGSVLAHFAPDGAVTVINSRGFLHKTAFFKICRWLLFCRNLFLGTCRFAHSMVERDVWMLERDTGMSRKEIVQESDILTSRNHAAEPPLPPGLSTDTRRPPPKTTAATAPTRTATPPPSAAGPGDCPYNVQIICGICWKKGARSTQDGNKDRCSKLHNLWHQIRMFQVLPSLKEIRPLPRKIPTNYHFIICKYVREKKKCDYNLGGPCQFAHGEEELEIWKWMCKNNVKTLDDLAEASRKAQLVPPPKPGESVVSVQKAAARVIAPSDLNFNPHYCQYCGIQSNSEKQWDNHCASERHTFNVNSDKDHQWNHRQPPWGIPSSSYDLCAKHMIDERCQYSHVPEMYNLCNYAHSEEELDEWKERYEWRQLKRDMAKKQKVFSYMDQLLEKYETSDSGIAVMSEEVEGVTVTPPMESLNVYREDKKASLVWTYIIRSINPLQKVALLYNRDRLHFTICSQDGKTHQIAPGDTFENTDAKGMACYRVDIKFTGGMFGSFSQWVIFDFGSAPVLVRKMSVEVGHQRIHEQVHSLRQKLAFDRWTSLNREIIRPGNMCGDEFNEQLLRKYKEPSSSEHVVTQNSIIAELNRNNYIHKMHKLLELEEMTRHHIISSYNLRTEIEIINQIEDKCAIYPRPGEMFGRVHLTENLTEDTNAGKLILTSVKKVLMAPVNDSKKTVYEANIVREDNFNYDGRGKEYIYLCIPPVCVKGLKIRPEMKLELEIQFQMHRLHFCRMHYAIDCLKNTDIVFPDFVQLSPEWNEKHVLKISSKILNDDQMAAVKHIVAERTGYTPTFIMFGPFGTGKTETLAQAAMVLLKERKETKILICAQSNSAADLYIVKHLDPFLRRNSSVSLRRIYIKERRVNTVPPEVQKYCIFNAENIAFEFPSKEDIMNHRIVITTVETSLQLTKLGLQGYFTHIFIDEAAQALECETIMPLSLATERTCIVLTGDHKQISPKVYSPEARQLGFHTSLLERLYAYYESFSGKIANKSNNPLNIFLSINYRTKMEILRFISAIFYGGPDSLKAMGIVPSVVELTPLVFYVVQGREIQDSDSTSYYNMSEVEEIVERVEDLFNNWPTEWGERAPQEIEVVTPYYDQVVLIRHMLRKRRPELRRISVDTIHNVQGKEFRALFISTCRTRHLLESSHVENLLKSSECDGDIGDFGFLSDPKLLNTALTRAKSYVCVVGDPVGLCAVGECVQVWRTYLKHCANMKSLFPPSVTYDSIKSQVLNLQMSPMGLRLTEITELSRNADVMQRASLSGARGEKDSKVWQSKNGPGSSTSQPAPASSHTLPPSSRTVTPTQQPSQISRSSPVGQKPVAPQPLRPLGTNGFMPQPPPLKQFSRQLPVAEDKQVVTHECDGIIKQIAADGGDGSHLDMECIRVKEDGGHAVVHYDTTWAQEKRRLQSDEDQDSDTALLDEEQGQRNLLKNYSIFHLRSLIQSSPDKYKHCVLHIESSRKMFARVIDVTSPIHQIKLSSRRHCGQAFNNDEVVVEVLEHEAEHHEVHGQVVGILRRAIDPSSKSFVCSVEASRTGVLIPINRGIPRIFNLTTPTQAQMGSSEQVCVYRLRQDQKVEFSHFETVNPKRCNQKLFLVRYLKWDLSFYCPFGIVIGVLPEGRDLDTGMKLVDLEHSVSQKDVDNEIMAMYHNYSLPQELYNSREDLTDRWCFTVTKPSSQDLDQAMSIEQTADGMYEVGMHTSDIAFFLQQGSSVDEEAQRRGASFFPLSRDPLHMLPNRLSTDLCSIQPDEDRLTLSVFMTVNGSGEITKVDMKKCIINSKKRFSFRETEEILHNSEGAQTDYFTSCMVVLYQVALLWRRNRLGNDYLCVNLEGSNKMTPKAHLLMEELGITANHQVAKILLNVYPQATPLKCQGPMNQQLSDEWKEKHATDAINTVALTKPFLDGNRICKCRVACTCIFTYIRQRGIQAQGTFDIIKGLWKTLCIAADTGNYELVQQLIVAPENHPQLAIAQAELCRIQEPTNYACSADVSADKQGHYSLNVTPFTSFTRPLSSYIDVVVQRLMAARIDNTACPYSKLDIQTLCSQFSSVLNSEHSYDQAMLTLHLAAALRKKPIVMHPVVEKVDDSTITLLFPNIKDVPVLEKNVKMVHLGLSDKPEVSEDPVEVKVKWQERIYDTAGPVANMSQADRGKELDPDKFVNQVPAFHWQRLLNAIREEDFAKLQTMVSSVRDQVESIVPEGHFAEDVSSEGSRNRNASSFVDFSLKLHPSMVMCVQIAAEVNKGLLTPKVQLLHLTPKLDICLEHRTSPMKCFTGSTAKPASRPTYSSERDYQQCWMPIIGMEAATRAVESLESIIVHNVSVEWGPASAASYSGKITLPVNFCKERKIKFSSDIQFDDLLDKSSSLAQSFFQDFMCVRYKELQLPPDPTLQEDVSVLLNSSDPVTWVGHCRVRGVERMMGEQLQVQVDLNQSSMALPDQLLGPEGARMKCTVEWIAKTPQDRNAEYALRCLDGAADLARAIATGRKPVDNNRFADVDVLAQMPCTPLPPPNQNQQRATQEALSQPFTVIHGPPGTGKTMTGAKLASMFCERNKKSPNQPAQVLICGPTNKSLHVVAAYLLSMGPRCPRLVHVYSEKLERRDYPLPRDPIAPKKRKASEVYVDPHIKQIALHELIRQAANQYSQQIQELDTLFGLYPDDISDDQINDYLELITTASVAELQQAEILLATCSTSARHKMNWGTNVQQVIIDECGMCTEPEAMIPIILFQGVKQVVLIGDHHQLQPPVKEMAAKQLGLNKSLFERYASRALMLTTQYRMHEGIAEFPSRYFYSDRLECGTSSQLNAAPLSIWPNGRNQPVTFCHVAGTEDSQTPAATSTQSKINDREVNYAVTIATSLVNRYRVSESDIVVLSQHQAQCAAIQKKLQLKGLRKITVCTVLASQGREWDYVIISTVRSMPKCQVERQPTSGWICRNMGAVVDHHQVNVAITRARKGLVLIGNKYLLQCDPLWRELLRDYRNKQKLLDADDFLRLMT